MSWSIAVLARLALCAVFVVSAAARGECGTTAGSSGSQLGTRDG
jgi:hypothetical protein